jgi:hypothetical protein
MALMSACYMDVYVLITYVKDPMPHSLAREETFTKLMIEKDVSSFRKQHSEVSPKEFPIISTHSLFLPEVTEKVKF